MTITIDASDMWPGNAQAEITNKDLGLFFGLKRESASTNFMLRRNILASEKLLHKVFEFYFVNLSSDMS